MTFKDEFVMSKAEAQKTPFSLGRVLATSLAGFLAGIIVGILAGYILLSLLV